MICLPGLFEMSLIPFIVEHLLLRMLVCALVLLFGLEANSVLKHSC